MGSEQLWATDSKNKQTNKPTMDFLDEDDHRNIYSIEGFIMINFFLVRCAMNFFLLSQVLDELNIQNAGI